MYMERIFIPQALVQFNYRNAIFIIFWEGSRNFSMNDECRGSSLALSVSLVFLFLCNFIKVINKSVSMS